VLRRRVVTIALVVALLAAGCRSGDSGTVPPASPGPGPDGPFAVGTHVETFVDTTRPTPAGEGNPGAPDRVLETTIWYPAAGEPGGDAVPGATPLRDKGPFPIVELSHGVTATGPLYHDLATEWAAAGYVVVTPTFPASSGPGGSQYGDFVSQPADVSFVLDQVTAEADEEDQFLFGLVDSEHIAVTGHSLGGLTTLGSTMNTCCLDPRVDAAIPMAAPFEDFPGGTFFPGDNPPVLLVRGDNDELVPVDVGDRQFAGASAPKFLLTIENGTHLGPYLQARDDPGAALVFDATIAFLDRYLKDRPAALDRLDAVVAASGLATLVEDLET
jgi:alpha-beta hydrolase superfamily lysophospholipase